MPLSDSRSRTPTCRRTPGPSPRTTPERSSRPPSSSDETAAAGDVVGLGAPDDVGQLPDVVLRQAHADAHALGGADDVAVEEGAEEDDGLVGMLGEDAP